jgi:hypothetical protein
MTSDAAFVCVTLLDIYNLKAPSADLVGEMLQRDAVRKLKLAATHSKFWQIRNTGFTSFKNV